MTVPIPGALLASIPSPTDGVFNIGPLAIHAYGMMIALGVVAAVWLAGRRMEKAGVGTRDDMSSIAMWAVGAGVIGARLYYIVTDKSQPWKEPGRWLKIWEGGLGIPGGLLAGVLVGAWAIKRRGLSVPGVLTAAAPAIPLAQAIGRLGNWWNQELFGRPSDLLWAVQISPTKAAAAGYPGVATFHPTFLYEMLWNLGLFAVLVLVDRRRNLRPGTLLPIYIGGYFLGRLWIEALRVDTASIIFGLRVNIWLSILGIVGAIVAVAVRGLRHRPDDSDEPYRDGHRWVPPGDEAQAELADGTDGPGVSEVEVSEVEVSDAPGVSDGPGVPRPST